MFMQNPVDYMENPYGYYHVDVKSARDGSTLGRFRERGPLATAEARIRAKLAKRGMKPVMLRAHIYAYVNR